MKRSSLKGVCAEWDGDATVRERVRIHHRLFIKAPLQEKPRANVDCAEVNFASLKPLVRRLKDSKGNVGMLSVPAIEVESLRLNLFV